MYLEHVDNVAEEGKQLPGGLKSERHLAQVVKDYDKLAAEMRKSKDPSVESKINGPFVHNLPKRKPAQRIQYLPRCTDEFWSCILFTLNSSWYLEFEEIPISLRKTEKRPVSQRKTKDHAKRKADTIERKLKKTKRVHEQRTHWDELQKKGLKTDPKWK